jgi:hypothetical protein
MSSSIVVVLLLLSSFLQAGLGFGHKTWTPFSLQAHTQRMEQLDVELVGLILCFVDRLALPASRAVCRRWQRATVPLSPLMSASHGPHLFSLQLAGWGWLSVLQWAQANGCPWHPDACGEAAQEGHLDVLDWMLAKGYLDPADSSMVCCQAAQGGRMAVLEWLRDRGCRWDALTCAGAALGGHLALLQRLRAEGCPWDRETYLHAANSEVLQWALANGCPVGP